MGPWAHGPGGQAGVGQSGKYWSPWEFLYTFIGRSSENSGKQQEDQHQQTAAHCTNCEKLQLLLVCACYISYACFQDPDLGFRDVKMAFQAFSMDPERWFHSFSVSRSRISRICNRGESHFSTHLATLIALMSRILIWDFARVTEQVKLLAWNYAQVQVPGPGLGPRVPGPGSKSKWNRWLVIEANWTSNSKRESWLGIEHRIQTLIFDSEFVIGFNMGYATQINKTYT